MRAFLGCLTLAIVLLLTVIAGAMIAGAAGSLVAVGIVMTWLGRRSRPRRKPGWS